MIEQNNNKLNEEALEQVVGGFESGRYEVIDITPRWVESTAVNGLDCRYEPDGEIAKTYEYGHRLRVDGITADGKWYRLLINDPRGGVCYAYIYKDYTERI